MGPERDDELGAKEAAEAKRQQWEKLHGEARQLVGEAQFLVDEAKKTIEESEALIRARKERSWSFVTTCPEGHDSEQTDLDRATLRKRLADGAEIPLHCQACGAQWNATREQCDRLRWAIRNLP